MRRAPESVRPCPPAAVRRCRNPRLRKSCTSTRWVRADHPSARSAALVQIYVEALQRLFDDFKSLHAGSSPTGALHIVDRLRQRDVARLGGAGDEGESELEHAYAAADRLAQPRPRL